MTEAQVLALKHHLAFDAPDHLTIAEIRDSLAHLRAGGAPRNAHEAKALAAVGVTVDEPPQADPIEREAVEAIARLMAESINGGDWRTDYTEVQRAGWRLKAEFCQAFGQGARDAALSDAMQAIMRAGGVGHALRLISEMKSETTLSRPLGGITVDELAQIIRRVDGNHDLGAGALADAILAELSGGAHR